MTISIGTLAVHVSGNVLKSTRPIHTLTAPRWIVPPLNDAHSKYIHKPADANHLTMGSSNPDKGRTCTLKKVLEDFEFFRIFLLSLKTLSLFLGQLQSRVTLTRI
jgi:hypothetical protein